MNKYYYTFGTDPRFPFAGGWIEVLAESWEQANALFRVMYPDRTPGILNCAFVYTEEKFKETEMYKNRASGKCHGVLGFFKRFYLYKNYNDGLAYGEEYTHLFSTKDEAIAHLKSDVVSDYRPYGDTFEEIAANPEFANDFFSDTAVDITNAGGDTNHYRVEVLELSEEAVI